MLLPMTLLCCGKVPSASPTDAAERMPVQSAATLGVAVQRSSTIVMRRSKDAPAQSSNDEAAKAPPQMYTACKPGAVWNLDLRLAEPLRKKVHDEETLRHEVERMSSALNDVLFPNPKNLDWMSAITFNAAEKPEQGTDKCFEIKAQSVETSLPILGSLVQQGEKEADLEIHAGKESCKPKDINLDKIDTSNGLPRKEFLERVAACVIAVTIRHHISNGEQPTNGRYAKLARLDDGDLIHLLLGIKHGEQIKSQSMESSEGNHGLSCLIAAQRPGNELTSSVLFEALLRERLRTSPTDNPRARLTEALKQKCAGADVKASDSDLRHLTELLDRGVFKSPVARPFTAGAHEILLILGSQQADHYKKAMAIWEELRKEKDARLQVLAEQRMIVVSVLREEWKKALEAQDKLENLTESMTANEKAEATLLRAIIYMKLEQDTSKRQRFALEGRGLTRVLKEEIQPLREIFNGAKAKDAREINALDPLDLCKQEEQEGKSCASSEKIRSRLAKYLGDASKHFQKRADEALEIPGPPPSPDMAAVHRDSLDPALYVYALGKERSCRQGRALSKEGNAEIATEIRKARGRNREKLISVRARCALAALEGFPSSGTGANSGDSEALIRWVANPPSNAQKQATAEEEALDELQAAQYRQARPVLALLRYVRLQPAVSAYANWVREIDPSFGKRMEVECKERPKRRPTLDEWRSKLLGFWPAIVKPASAKVALGSMGEAMNAPREDATLIKKAEGFISCKNETPTENCPETFQQKKYQRELDNILRNNWGPKFDLNSICSASLGNVGKASEHLLQTVAQEQAERLRDLIALIKQVAKEEPLAEEAGPALVAYLRIVGEYVSGDSKHTNQFRRQMTDEKMGEVLEDALKAFGVLSYQGVDEMQLRRASDPDLAPSWFDMLQRTDGIVFKRAHQQGRAPVRSVAAARAALADAPTDEATACEKQEPSVTPQVWVRRFLRHAALVRVPYQVESQEEDFSDANIAFFTKDYARWCSAGALTSNPALVVGQMIQERDVGWSALFDTENQFLRFIHEFRTRKSKEPSAYLSPHVRAFFPKP